MVFITEVYDLREYRLMRLNEKVILVMFEEADIEISCSRSCIPEFKLYPKNESLVKYYGGKPCYVVTYGILEGCHVIPLSNGFKLSLKDMVVPYWSRVVGGYTWQLLKFNKLLLTLSGVIIEHESGSNLSHTYEINKIEVIKDNS